MALLSFLFGRSKKGIFALAEFTGTKPEKIFEMVSDIQNQDPERARLFLFTANKARGEGTPLEEEATTFFIYRTFIRNRHPQEFIWWFDSLSARGAIPNHISLRELEVASIYLRKIGLGQEQISEAQHFYNEMFSARAM